MKIDHSTKTITYEPYELHMVVNYIEHCVAVMDRKNWRLNEAKKKPVERIKSSGR